MDKKKRIVIVGGVAGGASAAAKARRISEDAEIVLFERGDYISFANCGLPYHIGGQIKDRERLLVQTPEAMARRFRVDVRTCSEVTAIDRDKQVVKVHDANEDRTYEQAYDVLILSPGAEPFQPPITGAQHERVRTLRNVGDMDAIKKLVDEGNVTSAVVVGGGYIGLEMAEALIDRGLRVSLVELEGQVMGPADPEMAAPLHEHLLLQGVDLRLKTSMTSIEPKGDDLDVLFNNGDRVRCGLVIMAVGVRPEVKLAKEAGLALGPRGGIQVDEHMRTEDPAIYAVGDAVEVIDFVGGFSSLVPLAGPANRQGRLAAINAFGGDAVYRKTQGTAICKVFDLAIGMTGMSEKALKRAKMAYEKVYVHPANHAGYYPGAVQLSLKLLFDPKSGKVLGGQCVGADGVDKRIDVLAVAIRAGMTVYDLEELELSYAPPFGSAKDPINYAGFVAGNLLRGDMAQCHVPEVIEPTEQQLLLDVRTLPEVQQGTIPGSKHVPIDELRDRLGELSQDKEILVFCQVGLRGYLACRILSQHGFKCRNLGGGYKTYRHVTGLVSESSDVAAEIKNDTGEGGGDATETQKDVQVVRELDCCGLQCPGPIIQLKQAIDDIKPGQAVRVTVTDLSFAADLQGWCHTTGCVLLEQQVEAGRLSAVVQKAAGGAALMPRSTNGKTIVVFSDSFDKGMASFIIANGAAAMGGEVTLFFTFWGLNLLRKDHAVAVQKTLVERMFGWMMPRGANKTKLSQMNMGGMGTAMIKGIMKEKNVLSLPELIAAAQKAGVRLVACGMTMDLMGIKREELIDGVEEGGVGMYLDKAGDANVNLFIG